MKTYILILAMIAVPGLLLAQSMDIGAGAVTKIGVGVSVSVGTAASPGVVTNTSNAGLLIKSGSSGSGSLICGGTPNATVERYYTGGEWHLISAPINNALSGIFTGLYLQSHDENSNLYSEIIPTNIPLTQGQGFALFNSSTATAEFAGVLNTGDVSMNLTRSSYGDAHGWNLVGNPYPSSVDWNASGWTKTNVGGSTYRLLADGSGSWAVWNGVTGTNGATQYIAAGQGFFVAVNDDGSTTGTLGFSSAVKAIDNTTFFKKEISELVKLKVTSNGFSDETVLYIDENSTDGFDNQIDAYKIFSFEPSAPNIFIALDENMAISAIPAIKSVPVGVKIEQGSGMCTIDAIEIIDFSQVYLKDEYANVITDLLTESYTFDYDPDIIDRFTLHFAALDVAENQPDINSIFTSGNVVNVMINAGQSAQVFVYGINGQLISSASFTEGLNQINMDGKTGFYIVNVISDGHFITKKVFIK